DGAAYNWKLQERRFAGFTPIVDFLHVVCYVYRAAWAVAADEAGRWRQYVEWLRACWQGRVGGGGGEVGDWEGAGGRAAAAGGGAGGDGPAAGGGGGAELLRAQRGADEVPRVQAGGAADDE